MQYRGVVEAQHRIASLHQPGVTVGVARLGQPMNPAIDFDDQLERMTGEVCDIGSDQSLPAEFDAMQPSIFQQGPDRGFGVSRRAA